VPIHFYCKFSFYHNTKRYSLYYQIVVAVVETRQSSSSVFFTELFSNRRQRRPTARALNPEALGVENFSTPQGRFHEGYREIPHESRKTSEMSNAMMSKHSDDENDDFSLLTNLISRRALNLTILNAFPGNCRWDRVATTCITLDINYQSFRTFYTCPLQCTLRRLLPNDERLA